MKRKIYTLLTGDKYPAWYPEPMAAFFKRFGVELHVFTDNEIPSKGEAHYHSIQGWPGDSPRNRCYGKVKFFDPETTGERQILVVDIDTVFLKDPTPIFDWVERLQETSSVAAAFVKDPVFKNHAGTSMFYLDFSRWDFKAVWDLYLQEADTEEKRKKTRMPGDQDLVTHAMFKYVVRWMWFPLNFQVQSRIFFKQNISKVWTKAIAENEDLDREEVLSVHFVGRSTLPHKEVEKFPFVFEEINHPILEWSK